MGAQRKFRFGRFTNWQSEKKLRPSTFLVALYSIQRLLYVHSHLCSSLCWFHSRFLLFEFFFSRSLNLVHKIYSIRASFRKNFNFFLSLTISYCMSYTTIVVRYRFMGARVYVWSTEFFLHCENLFDSIFRMHKLFPVSRSNAIIKQRMSRFWTVFSFLIHWSCVCMCFCFPL